jgi:hypothetical protein
MSLDNLLRIGRIKRHTTDRTEIRDLLAAARIETISTENRFDAAYKCVMQCALAALMASGFRPDTKVPGHHQTVIQSLPTTIGIAGSRVAVLDAFRNKRKLCDYTGKQIDPSSLAACVEESERLLGEVTAWLAANYPTLSP